MKYYHTVDDVLRSPWAAPNRNISECTHGSDRVLRSTKLEDSIYQEMRAGDDVLTQIEESASVKLASFPQLSRDIFQSFYSLMPKRNDEESMSVSARKFNAPILDHVAQSEDYPTLKSICEGRELPAYEAAAEFVKRTAEELDGLLGDLGGDRGALNTLRKLENGQRQAQSDLLALLAHMQQTKERNEVLESEIVKAANTTESKTRQVEAVSKMIDTAAARNRVEVSQLISSAVCAAAEKAQEVQDIIRAWGEDGGSLEKTPVNTELLALVRESGVLKDIAKYLGRFREIFTQCKRNSYAFGRGEKYSLELGNDLSRAITSELAMLAAPQTIPLFLRKYQHKQIKQYRRREMVYKSMGDIICCLDESDSTRGDPAAWGKAVALTLLEIAAENRRSFALIHFSGRNAVRTDVFRPGAYTVTDKMAAAAVFLGGGTNFETPMREAVRLIREEHFEKADIVFITDGECELSEQYLAELHEAQLHDRFTITGILMDKETGGMSFSLEKFCQDIYRTGELLGDEIMRKIVVNRV